MWALLWLLPAALFAVLFAAVVLPLRLRLRAQGGEKSRARLEIAPLGGALHIRLLDTARPRARPRPRSAPRVPSGKRARKGRQGWMRARAANMIAATPRLLSDLAGLVRLERLRIDGRLGLGDPADTGSLYAVLIPLRFLGPSVLSELRLEPDFEHTGFRGEADIVASMVPIALVPPILRWLWTGLVRR